MISGVLRQARALQDTVHSNEDHDIVREPSPAHPIADPLDRDAKGARCVAGAFQRLDRFFDRLKSGGLCPAHSPLILTDRESVNRLSLVSFRNA